MKISEYVSGFTNAVERSDSFTVVIAAISNAEKTFRESFIYDPVLSASPVDFLSSFGWSKFISFFPPLSLSVSLSLFLQHKTCSAIGETLQKRRTVFKHGAIMIRRFSSKILRKTVKVTSLLRSMYKCKTQIPVLLFTTND